MRTTSAGCWLAVVLALLAVAPAGPKSFRLARQSIEATVRTDGSMHVHNTLIFDFSGSFHHAYLEVKLPAGTRLTRLVVAEGARSFAKRSDETPGSYAVSHPAPDRVRADWHYQAQDEQRQFVVAYDIAGAVQKHADVAELYWMFVGKEWAVPSDLVTVRIHLPGKLPAAKIRAWGHGPLSGEVRPVDGGAALRVTSLPPATMVEARVVLPRSVIKSSPRHDSKKALPAILAEEEAAADAANRAREQRRRPAPGPVPGGLGERERRRTETLPAAPFVVIAIAAALWLALYFTYGREHEEPNPPQYVTEPPQDWKPIEVAFLWRWGELNAADVTATLMDLVRRGALKLDVRPEARPRLGGLLGDETVDVCHLEWVKDFRQPLSPCEQYLIREMLFARRAPGDAMTLDEFRELVEFNQGAMARRYERWVELAKAEAERLPITDPKSQWAMWAGAAIGGLLFIATFRLAADYQLAGLLPGVVGIGMVFGSTAIQRRNPEAAQALHQWQAFRRHLRDFSDLKEYPAPAVEVWDRYLVYAITLGVADRVRTQFEGLYPGRVPEGPTEAQIRAVSTAGFARLLTAASAAMSSLGATAAVTGGTGGSGHSVGMASSAGGGGGGFSGGEGGSGGGGGGGAD